MNLDDLKLDSLGINKNTFGKIYTFVDFGNVNKWFDKDVWGLNDHLAKDQKLIVDIIKMGEFINLFSEKKWFYYGINQRSNSSLHLTIKAKNNGFKTVSKDIQWIKHYLLADEESAYKTIFSGRIKKDDRGYYLLIPKCNFDVEICLDAMRLIDKYDTICLFSSDSDFARLLAYLKQRGKKIILIKGGNISSTLKNVADVIISAQNIKLSLCSEKAS